MASSEPLAKPDAGRPDYNAAAHFTQLQPGEPYFLIRGRDALSAPAVRAWAALAYEALAPLAIVEKALQQADAMDAWSGKQLPNADHLSDAEVLQLAYQLERRGWNAQADGADARIMLAEERAFSQALGRLRPLLSRFFDNLVSGDDGAFTYTPPRDGDGQPLPGPCPVEGLRRLSTALRGSQPDQT
jgi:hypothetical protein